MAHLTSAAPRGRRVRRHRKTEPPFTRSLRAGSAAPLCWCESPDLCVPLAEAASAAADLSVSPAHSSTSMGPTPVSAGNGGKSDICSARRGGAEEGSTRMEDSEARQLSHTQSHNTGVGGWGQGEV